MSQNTTQPLLEPCAVQLLSRYYIPYPKHGMACSAAEAVSIADRIGYPVVLKIVSSDVIHKSDIGGVISDLSTAQAVAAGFERVIGSTRERVPGARIYGVLVCEQASPGPELIIGGLRDPLLGPAVMVGLGGIFTELLGDVAFRVAPFARKDAKQMLTEIRGYPLLTGARGGQPCDMDAIVDLLVKVSCLVSDRDDIVELDLNPVRVYEHGLLALDARIISSGTSPDDGLL